MSKISLLKENPDATCCCCIAFLTKTGEKGVVLEREKKHVGVTANMVHSPINETLFDPIILNCVFSIRRIHRYVYPKRWTCWRERMQLMDC